MASQVEALYPEVSPRSKLVESSVKDFGNLGRCATIGSLLALETGIFLCDMEQLSSKHLDEILNNVITWANGQMITEPRLLVEDLANDIERYYTAYSKLVHGSKITHSASGIFEIRSIYDDFNNYFPFCLFITKVPDDTEVICICFQAPGSTVIFDPIARKTRNIQTKGAYCIQQSSFLSVIEFIQEIWPVDLDRNFGNYLHVTVAARSQIKFEKLPNFDLAKMEMKRLAKRVDELSETVTVLQRNNAQLEAKLQQIEQRLPVSTSTQTDEQNRSETAASHVTASSFGSYSELLFSPAAEDKIDGRNETREVIDEKVLCALCLQLHSLESVIELSPCGHRLCCEDAANYFIQFQQFSDHLYCPVCQTKLNGDEHQVFQ